MTVKQLMGVLQACDPTDEVKVRIGTGPDSGEVRAVVSIQPYWTKIILNTERDPETKP